MNEQPMRILVATPHKLDINTGAAGSEMILAELWRAAGHEVKFLSMDDLPAFAKRRSGRLLRRRLLNRMVRKAALTWAKDYDVIDAVDVIGPLRLDVRRARPAVVLRSHGSNRSIRAMTQRLHNSGIKPVSRAHLWQFGRKVMHLEAAERAADACVYINQMDAEEALQAGVVAEKVHVIPHGVDLSSLGLDREAEGTDETREGSNVITTLGTFNVRKGCHLLPEVLERVKAAVGDVRLRLLGTGRSEAEVLQAFPSELKASVEVVPRFDRGEVRRLTADASVALFPSLSEGFGIALVELMACGLAPVAFDVGGPRDILSGKPELERLRVRLEDVPATASRVVGLLQDRAALAAAQRAARSRAAEYPWDRAAAARLAVFASAVAARREGVAR